MFRDGNVEFAARDVVGELVEARGVGHGLHGGDAHVVPRGIGGRSYDCAEDPARLESLEGTRRGRAVYGVGYSVEVME